jgi:putative transposase
VARRLKGVRLVISDSHEGLQQAIAAVLVGASRQRCRVYFIGNMMARVPKSPQPMVATLKPAHARRVFSDSGSSVDARRL